MDESYENLLVGHVVHELDERDASPEGSGERQTREHRVEVALAALLDGDAEQTPDAELDDSEAGAPD